MGTPQPLLSFIFGHFKQISSQFLQQICEKCPSSIRFRDSKPLHLEHESPPMTTRPGLPDVLHKLDNDIFYFTLMMFTTECIIIVWCKNTNYGQNFYCAPTMVISFASQYVDIASSNPFICWLFPDNNLSQNWHICLRIRFLPTQICWFESHNIFQLFCYQLHCFVMTTNKRKNSPSLRFRMYSFFITLLSLTSNKLLSQFVSLHQVWSKNQLNLRLCYRQV